MIILLVLTTAAVAALAFTVFSVLVMKGMTMPMDERRARRRSS